MLIQGIDVDSLPDQFEGYVQGRTLVLDGDGPCYVISSTVKRLDTAIRNYQQYILTQLFLTKSQDCRIHLTAKDSTKAGRYNVKAIKPYQGQRKGKDKPALLEPLREAIALPQNWLPEFEVLLHRELEADDGSDASEKDDTILAVPGIEKTTPAFRRKLVEVAKSVGTNPDWLAALISNESAGTFSPSIANMGNPTAGAVGLIQFMPETAATLFGYKKYSMSPEDWKDACKESRTKMMSMDALSQLDYVKKFFATHRGKLNSPEDLYMATFWPKGVGQPSDYVIATKGSNVYKQNYQAFDQLNEGVITKGNVGGSIRSRINSAKGKRIPIDSLSSSPIIEPSIEDHQQDADELLQELSAMGPIEKMVKQAIQKKLLPLSRVAVCVDGPNLSSKVSFAHSITKVLKEIIDVNAGVGINGNNVELDCYGYGTPFNLTNAIQELCDCAIIKTASHIVCKSIPNKDYYSD